MISPTIKYITALTLVMIWTTIGWAISIKPSVDTKDLTVGDKFVYKNEVAADSSLQPIPLGEKLGDATVLSPIFQLKKSQKGTDIYACTLAVYQPGEIKIPAFSFRRVNSPDTSVISGDTMTVNIKSILPPDTTGMQIADIRGPKRLWGPIWPYLLIAAILALAIFGIIWLRRKLRKAIAGPAIPPIPPWEMALKRLDELKASRHLDFGRFKQFYFELSMIVRAYIEGRFDTLAVESTTYEIENDPKLKALDRKLYDRLFELFNRADLAKFAKSIPTQKEAESDITFAYDFVVETKPAPIVTESGNAPTPPAAGPEQATQEVGA